ncbi:alanine/ornithine racemase family PLP-dependent enzyme [Haloarchaeobius sp. HRN-SO-5]|uniref:alanine/ornithine racemase family PLP-dependent enzyme n=1 Tax=Haloarchaeobius sp. HRN-SO-5 TaxID=3446118 RepID=UPI003EBB033A
MAPAPTCGVDAPTVHVDLDAIRENARAVCARFDGRVVGVTKAVTGDPAVARAMLDGGVDGIGDSRLLNLARVGGHVDAESTLLVSPMSEHEDVVATADRSLHSEVAVVEAVAASARDRGVTHDVVLMVDTGDRREGVLPGDVLPTLRRVVDLDGVRVVGVGTNAGCFGGVLPMPEAMAEFVELVEDAEQALDRTFPVVSGGSSVTLPLVEDGTLPDRVNELRVGEAILLGTDVTRDREIPYLRGDAFTLRAEVVECRRKPSTPDGPTGHDVDGNRPDFEDRGVRERAILALGRQDAVIEDLVPLAAGVEVLGASSDHTVCDVTDAADTVTVGDTLEFRMGYRALVQAFTSEYVGRTLREGTGDDEGAVTE